MQTVKIAANSATLNAASNCESAKCVYVWNSNTTTAALITYNSNSAVQIGTLVLPPNTAISIAKRADETLAANLNAGVLYSPIAFTN